MYLFSSFKANFGLMVSKMSATHATWQMENLNKTHTHTHHKKKERKSFIIVSHFS
jgi:hypothetical protein